MFRRLLGGFLMMGLAAVLFLSCGSSNSITTPGTGTLFSFIGDAPSCDILTFRVLITDVVLTPASGPGMGHGLPVNSTPKVNFAAWRNASTILGTNSVAEDTYTQGKLVISIPNLVVFDPTQSPPIRTVAATLPSTTPSFPIEPPLTVTKGEVGGLSIDFDMLHSIQFETDSTGKLTATVSPTIAFRALTASTTQGFGETSARGFVESVTTTSTTVSANGTPFVGGFTMQLLAPSLALSAGAPSAGPAVAVNLTSATQLCGPMTGPEICPSLLPNARGNPLNTLLTGSVGNVDGYVDSKGFYIAKSAELEDQEDVSRAKAALLGPVLSVIRDSNGNVTQFSLFVREEQPSVEFGSPGLSLDTVVTVNTVPAPYPPPPAASTLYGDAWRVAHPGGLQFGPTALTVGQEVAVHGVFTPPASGVTPAPPATVAADAIYLQLQTYQGNFTSLLQAGSDDKSGAFTFVPCGTMFQGVPVMVFTDSQTTFLNGGLNELTPQPSLLLKGLLFFDQQGRTINPCVGLGYGCNVTVPPGTLVLLASQVHQLQ